MEHRSSSTSPFNFLGTLASTLRTKWIWHLWTFALENSSLKTHPRPLRQSMMPKVTLFQYSLQLFRSLHSSLQQEVDSFLPPCKGKTVRFPLSVFPIITRTGTLSMQLSTLIDNVTQLTNRYLNDSPDRSLSLNCSNFQPGFLLALLTSLWEIFRPISLSDIMESERVITHEKNREQILHDLLFKLFAAKDNLCMEIHFTVSWNLWGNFNYSLQTQMTTIGYGSHCGD